MGWDHSDKQFIGLANYEQLFQDEQFWTSLRNNVYWLVLFLLGPVGGVAIAIFLNQQLPGMRLVKSLFFFPFVLSQVVIGLVFSWFYDPTHGLLNAVLGIFGVPPIAPLSDPNTVTFAIIAAGLWPQVSYCMILFLAGLTAVDPEQIEAGRLDGAKGFRMFWHIIMPQLRPATFHRSRNHRCRCASIVRFGAGHDGWRAVRQLVDPGLISCFSSRSPIFAWATGQRLLWYSFLLCRFSLPSFSGE